MLSRYRDLKIKVKFSRIFLTSISTLKEENKIVLTKMAKGLGLIVLRNANLSTLHL